MKAMPPTPLMNGSTTPMAKAVATAASMALPPRRSISAPASAASGCIAATIPPLDTASVLSIIQLLRVAIVTLLVLSSRHRASSLLAALYPKSARLRNPTASLGVYQGSSMSLDARIGCPEVPGGKSVLAGKRAAFLAGCRPHPRLDVLRDWSRRGGGRDRSNAGGNGPEPGPRSTDQRQSHRLQHAAGLDGHLRRRHPRRQTFSDRIRQGRSIPDGRLR